VGEERLQVWRERLSLLGTSLKDTYEMYPYRESHGTRELSRQECHIYMHYLYYEGKHVIPTYNSTCRIGERVA
jgi:hypothetical protein